jgi:hypothetical protein
LEGSIPLNDSILDLKGKLEERLSEAQVIERLENLICPVDSP